MERSLLPFSNGKVMCSFHLASCSTEKSQETREEERCLNFLIARLLAAVGNVVLSVVPSGPDRPDQVQLFPRCIESGPLVVELCLATRVVFRSLSSCLHRFPTQRRGGEVLSQPASTPRPSRARSQPGRKAHSRYAEKQQILRNNRLCKRGADSRQYLGRRSVIAMYSIVFIR